MLFLTPVAVFVKTNHCWFDTEWETFLQQTSSHYSSAFDLTQTLQKKGWMSFIFPVCKQHEHFTEGQSGEKQCLWEPTNPLLTGLQSAACAHLLSHLIRSHPLTSSCWLCWVWLFCLFLGLHLNLLEDLSGLVRVQLKYKCFIDVFFTPVSLTHHS